LILQNVGRSSGVLHLFSHSRAAVGSHGRLEQPRGSYASSASMAVAVQPNRGREGVAAVIATSKRRADLDTTREGGKSAATPQIRARKGGREIHRRWSGWRRPHAPTGLGDEGHPCLMRGLRWGRWPWGGRHRARATSAAMEEEAEEGDGRGGGGGSCDASCFSLALLMLMTESTESNTIDSGKNLGQPGSSPRKPHQTITNDPNKQVHTHPCGQNPGQTPMSLSFLRELLSRSPDFT
jgi:hypothetical protein